MYTMPLTGIIRQTSDDSVAFIKPRLYDSIWYASPPYICDTAAGGLLLPKKHNALVVQKILKIYGRYETHTRLPCIYYLNLIDYHISLLYFNNPSVAI
jgi:hypothetical protein